MVNDARSSESGRTFVVECYWPGLIEERVRRTVERVVHLTRGGASESEIRSLGCILLPSDGMALFLFRARGEADVKDISRLAEVPFDRIVPSIHIRADDTVA